MSDKERLGAIKEARKRILNEKSFQKKCIFLNSFEELGYLDWLIEQVEQLQWENDWLNTLLAAEKRNRIRASNEATSYKQQLQQAQTKAERYEKALRKIIDESICRGEDCTWGDTCYAVISRKALEGEE